MARTKGGPNTDSDSDSDNFEAPFDCSIPSPPRLPSTFTDRHGWSLGSKVHLAKLKDDGSGFDVSPDDIPTEDESDWPYYLGPPTSSPECHPLIEKWGLQILNAAGFIDYEHEDENEFRDPKGRYYDIASPPEGIRKAPVHPVLRQNMFPNISDKDYELITPALLLASALLDDPTTLNVFDALSVPSHLMSTLNTSSNVFKFLKIPATLSQADQAQTYAKIVDMVQWTSWAFRDGAKMRDNTNYGATSVIARDASASGTSQTYINLNGVHLEVLRLYDKTSSDEEEESDDEEMDSDDNQANCDYEALLEDTLDIAGIKESWKLPEFHLTSAILRTYLQLAVVIVHEFANAFNRAYYVRQPGEIFLEPWVAGDRSNELGWALIHHVLAGNPRGTTIWFPPMSRKEFMLQTLSAPFGLHFGEPWDWPYGSSPIRSMMALWARDSVQKLYPVPQQHVYELWGREMWTHKVPKFGLRALQMPKQRGWAAHWYPNTRKGLYGTGQERWDVGGHAP
ncbi:hypothetical protein E4T47_00243 [Aureobasidium subglaciale]|nr:hypothetical protein E4T47_00243 [Aureobasidium subglaciale]